MLGGVWGTFPKNQIPEILQPYINNHELGGICEPFFLEDGFHIIKINDDQTTIEDLIRQSRTERMMRGLIDDYRQQIYIEISCYLNL